jgi:DNA-binding transcriptional regulator YiaG
MYDPAYPENPSSLAEYIRRYRKDKGLLVRGLSKRLGIHEFTLIKWEGGRKPRYQKQVVALTKGVPGVERWLNP